MICRVCSITRAASSASGRAQKQIPISNMTTTSLAGSGISMLSKRGGIMQIIAPTPDFRHSLMSIRQKLIRAGLAAGAWLVIWAVLSFGLAIGVNGAPDPTLALHVLCYAGASGIVFGFLAFTGCWQVLPLWLRGALYGLLAAAPEVLALIVLFPVRSGTIDWWWLAAAAMLSGLFGYLLRELLVDWLEPTTEPTAETK